MWQEWQLQEYRQAAEQMCVETGGSPYDSVMLADGRYVPRWVEYAERMADFAVMVRTMRNFGVLPL